MIWEQIKYLLFFGALHSAALAGITEYFKRVWGLSNKLQRWLPLLLAFPTSFLLLPIALKFVELNLNLTPVESVATGATGAILAASGSKFVYDLLRLLKDDLIGAIRAKIKNYGDK